MTQTSDQRFRDGLAYILEQFNYERVITTIQLIQFGWAANAPENADWQWYYDECRKLIRSTAEHAYKETKTDNERWFCECGGFRADVHPDGTVEVMFVLASWDNREDMDDATLTTTTTSSPRRRLIPLTSEVLNDPHISS